MVEKLSKKFTFTSSDARFAVGIGRKKNTVSEREFFIPFTSHNINIINLMKLNFLQTVSIYENVRETCMRECRKKVSYKKIWAVQSVGQNWVRIACRIFIFSHHGKIHKRLIISWVARNRQVQWEAQNGNNMKRCFLKAIEFISVTSTIYSTAEDFFSRFEQRYISTQ